MTPSSAQPFTSVSTDELYDTWAATYDSDGNVLQAVDDLELQPLLPRFIRLVCQGSTARASENKYAELLRILDFGCGTGRNTLKLLQANWTAEKTDGGPAVELYGWDASASMLKVAREKCSAQNAAKNVKLHGLEQMDFSDASVIPRKDLGSFDGIVSTLVLEHLPLDTFFGLLSGLLKPDGVALVTNMHADMGRVTQAGYKTETGERIKGQSFAHTVEESVHAAQEAGLVIMGEVRQATVDEGMMRDGHVGKRGKKWLGVNVWYGFIIRKRVG